MIHALVEIDVTGVRSALRRLRRDTGIPVSMTAYYVWCFARAVTAHPHVHAYRDWRNRLVIYDEVDVSTTVEKESEDGSTVVPVIIRRAESKSLREISDDLELARKGSADRVGVSGSIRLYLAIPAFVRRLVFRLLDRLPHLMKRFAGTAMLTSVGMFGKGAGWGIPVASHTVNVTVGGTVSRPVSLKGEVRDREHVCLTVSTDHDLVDGAPAARFVHRLRQLIEDADSVPS